MPGLISIFVLSDVHYASDAEKARGDDYEFHAITNPAIRLLLRAYRHFIWLRHPLRQNPLLDAFIERAQSADLVIANGDYTCDTAFVGVSDDAACQSVMECLGKLRSRFGESFRAIPGDHEFGKFSFVGRRGGMRFASYERVVNQLRLEPFWTHELGRYTLIGLTSSLVILPAVQAELLPQESATWERLREAHMQAIRHAFSSLKPDRRVVLFCHDPTALPFLWRESVVREKLSQIELTVIGHLHSNLIFWKSRMLAGMPELRFLGHSIRKMSRALHEARHWKPFNVRLCPSLAGSELLKDGGFLNLKLDPDAKKPLEISRHRTRR